MNEVKHMLYFRSSIHLTRPITADPIIKRMLERRPKKARRPAMPKEDVGRRLGEALDRAGEGAASRLAERCDVTVQAIGGWVKTGRFGVEHLPAIAKQLGISLDWLFIGTEVAGRTQPSAARQIVTAITGEYGDPPQTQEEADLLEAWRAWGDEIRGHVRRLMIDTALRGHPVLDAANTGSRVDQERFNAHIETAQRKARAKASAKKAAPVKRPRTPRP